MISSLGEKEAGPALTCAHYKSKRQLYSLVRRPLYVLNAYRNQQAMWLLRAESSSYHLHNHFASEEHLFIIIILNKKKLVSNELIKNVNNLSNFMFSL